MLVGNGRDSSRWSCSRRAVVAARTKRRLIAVVRRAARVDHVIEHFEFHHLVEQHHAAVRWASFGGHGPEGDPLQQRLAELHYDVSPDGRYTSATSHAVMAFQKVNGLGRDGVAGATTLAKLSSPVTPGPLVPGGGSTRVEVDVARQVLFFYKGNSLYRIVSVSTGSGQRFCVDGRCAIAVTPGGSFHVGGKVGGWQTGKLGRLYKPSYFNGNIAIHGALSVPGGPGIPRMCAGADDIGRLDLRIAAGLARRSMS